ncbi:MAG: hypothetical protein LBI18_08545 [Planctomycetaceae bacterium]|jgi:hypothetical protein|nr:hypothetical protein [Planctomycetaceae bacterium]
MEFEKREILFEHVLEMADLVKAVEEKTGKTLSYIALNNLTPEGNINQSVSLTFTEPKPKTA